MKKIYTDDTICAVATALGGGGSIGMIRISGGDSFIIAAKIFSGAAEAFESHKVYYGHICFQGEQIDEVLLIAMKGPKSYTREDVIEIHCHGGRQSVQRVLETVLMNGVRLAEPGEFTKRAFLNGRIDLSQAEAVLDIINAQTALSHKAAVHQLSGDLSSEIKKYRQAILAMVAHIEANIDYPENDIEELSTRQIQEQTMVLAEAIQKLLATADMGRILREGIETVILGRPNVGKSSLMNRLLNEERAIVTAIPGTTRDVLREYININNIPLKIIDTAGIRETDDEIEKIGVARTREYARKADLILAVIDGSEALSDEDIRLLEDLKGKKVIVLVNKIDLTQKTDVQALYRYADAANVIEISAKNNLGLDLFAERITELFFSGQIDYDNAVTVSNTRHKECLIRALASLQNALATIEGGFSQELISIDLTDAYGYLGEITGESLDEDIIDQIFSAFCLGK